MKIRAMGDELFHAGGRTQMTEAFRTFANAPENYKRKNNPIHLLQHHH
jgi:hypothetical protein